jgi:hypothetical protein
VSKTTSRPPSQSAHPGHLRRARRVKCDEARPSCRKCLASGRLCAGYVDLTPPSTRPAQYALILPKPGVILRNAWSEATAKIETLDTTYLDFFRLYTLEQLPGSDIGLPWTHIIFSTDSCEPVVVRAVAALGCIHQTQTDKSFTDLSGTKHYAEAFALYHKAVVALQRYINRTPELGLAVTTETTLLVVLLLFCFEVLSGNDQYAWRHLLAAFSMLSKQRIQHDPQGQATLVLQSRSASTIGLLTQLIIRLSSDWLVSGESCYGGDASPLQAVCRDRIPAQFQSEVEASVHLDALCSEASKHFEVLYEKALRRLDLQIEEEGKFHQCAKECLVMARSQELEHDSRSTFNIALNETIMSMSRWRSAFDLLIRSQRRSQPVLLLQLQFLQTWFSLIIIDDPGDGLCDGLRQEFELAISIAEEFTLTQVSTARATKDTDRTVQSLRNLGNNLASCICLVVEKCRDSGIRRRGIELLRTFDLRGTFDTPYLVAYYEHLVDAEETRARALNIAAPVQLRCEDIPQNARFVETLMCSCGADQNDGDFYRESSGAMVFVERSDHDGTLRPGESCFRVHRDVQI